MTSRLSDAPSAASRSAGDVLPAERVAPARLAMIGFPNTGKTTLFNRLCGLRAKTANFPGSTIEARIGKCVVKTTSSGGENDTHTTVEIVDLPGSYGLALDRPESCICRDYLSGDVNGMAQPDALLIIADATDLQRCLAFIIDLLSRGYPAVIALNMTDRAQRMGLSIDETKLSQRLGVPVIATGARSGSGIDRLKQAIVQSRTCDVALPAADDPQAQQQWIDTVLGESIGGRDAVGEDTDSLTERLDAAFTHPVLGIVLFAGVMTGLFYTIFALAETPMNLIDVMFGTLGTWFSSVLPPGAIREVVVDGIIPGIAGAVVFLPQICLLFFLIALLEDSGYLARAAFVMDRVLRRFGLPGQAFVPMLSAHACAIPAIMSARLIPDHRDRLATILVSPFLSCAARLPVYVLLIGLLFADQPLLAGLAFTGCYALGGLAAVISALIARRTILRGRSAPMVLELPAYSLPSLRSAVTTTLDRAMVFVRKAGTVIVGIAIVLWWLGAYPHVDPPQNAVALQQQAVEIEDQQPERAEALHAEADSLTAQHQTTSSFLGRIGRTAQPVFEPLGYDWQLTIGVLSSLLAREVFVSTMAVVVAGEEDIENQAVIEQVSNARRTDGSPIFTTATAASLLVYYVLAMQCLPTLAVTARETGSWKWAGLQLAWMTGLAYVLALLTYQTMQWMGAS